MNERIKELIKQATEHDYTTWDSYNQKELVYYKFNQEKFAELIVKECGSIISGLIVPETFEQDIGPYEKWNQALGHAALEIEQHFFGDAHE